MKFDALFSLQRWIVACQPFDGGCCFVDEAIDSVIAVEAYSCDPAAQVLQHVGIRTAVEDDARDPTSVRQDIGIPAAVELQVVQHFRLSIDQECVRSVIAVKPHPRHPHSPSVQDVRIGTAAERGIHQIGLREELVCSPASKHARIRCSGQ